MMTCKTSAEAMSRELEGPLPRGERIALGLHRLLCATCRRFRHQLAATERALGEHVSDAIAPECEGITDDARTRIRTRLQDAIAQP